MSLENVRLLFDFGLFVLIWLVQLVIYPGFQYYSKDNLIIWHRRYTFGISLVVIPSMFGQLITASIQLFQAPNFYTITSMILIGIVWGVTFLQFVPMHGDISKGRADKVLLKKLVYRNWWRTIIWAILLLWSFLVEMHPLLTVWIS